MVSQDSSLRDDGILRAMASSLSHRGPDEEGIQNIGRATLVSRRLAIIDVAHGHQPITSEDHQVMAVNNGEIYNFVQLREELRKLGHTFRTASDTEVIPHAYEEWGEDFVHRLTGMFALAVWDERRRQLVLARDRFGKKPLFYAIRPDAVVFASELHALLLHPSIRPDVDLASIDDYMTFGYVPAPRTAYLGIQKVEPAHVVVISNARAVARRYWVLRYSPKLADISLDEAAVRVRELIDRAVERRMVSEVPLGAFLSGGLDSSAVVALMSRHTAGAVRTFSIGFKDRRYDELRYARMVAQAFGTDHEELVVDAADTDVLPELVHHLGEPFADSSIVPTYQVARITRQHVAVVLNGDGGDELFAGYDRYRAAALARSTVERLPHGVRRGIGAAAGAMPEYALLPRAAVRARRFLAAMGLDPEDRYVRWTGFFTGPLRERVIGDALTEMRQDRLPLSQATALTGAVDPIDRFLAADISLGLPGDLLVKMDIATMKCSLEARSPLLDHELAEFVARLPTAFKASPFQTKIVLRRAMRDLLPAEVLGRRKMGFTAPVGGWLRGPLKELFTDTVLSGEAAKRGFVNPRAAKELYSEHLSGRADRTHLLWALLMLELWAREFMDRPASRPVSTSVALPHA